MKHLVILADGSADWPCPELGGKTLYQYADTPNIDRLASMGRVGMLKTVADGFHPGSEVANSTILGYDQHKVYQGRGVLEAASIGYEMKPGDMAMRCNIINIDGEILKNHSAGHISTQEAAGLIDCLNEHLATDKVHFHLGVQYRHVLIINGGDSHISCIPPHDVPLKPWRPLLVKADVPEAEATAELLNDLILRSQQFLPEHPVNKARAATGLDMANSIWPWSPGYRPEMAPLALTYPQIKNGSVITAVDLIRGIGRYAGLKIVDVEGATGLYDTNYEGKVQAALEALKTDDFVYLHIEAPDEAGHEGDIRLKLRTIEDIDHKVVSPVLKALDSFDEPLAVAFLPDHPTPCEYRTHTADPVPFIIYKPGAEADGVRKFDEEACKEGFYGLMDGLQFMPEFMK